MIARFVREQKRYTRSQMCSILECSESNALPVIQRLKEYGVLKAVKSSELQKGLSDLMEEDVDVADVGADESGHLYVFTFVGVIVVAGRVLKVYPKYLLSTAEPEEEMRQILKVLEKYHSDAQIFRLFDDSSESSPLNFLAVLLYLIRDYYENGVYSSTEQVIESNGSGEIVWDRTVNETFTLISNNRPYYTDLRTRKHVTDDHDYFHRLHECVLSAASRELDDAGLLTMFDLTGIDLTDAPMDDFGETDYILYRIDRELNVQFNTRKQLVLKAIRAFTAHGGGLGDPGCFTLFGTDCFNLVWEKVCADVMDSQLNVRLGELRLPIPLRPGYDPGVRLMDLIERPFWTAAGKAAMDTLIPDMIAISETGQGSHFVILDAKYHTPFLEEGTPPRSQPGIESVAKQYLYQLAYQRFIIDHQFAAVSNCFLMPTEQDEVVDRGEATMQILRNLGLQDIKVRLLPARMAYACYLSGSRMDVACLSL